jgi:hypothetical protein
MRLLGLPAERHLGCVCAVAIIGFSLSLFPFVRTGIRNEWGVVLAGLTFLAVHVLGIVALVASSDPQSEPVRTNRPLRRRRPSRAAEFILHLLMEPRSCDALVGDLNERHRFLRKRFGRRKANFWYWVQVFRSVGPIVWVGSIKILKRLSGLAAAVEMVRRIRG